MPSRIRKLHKRRKLTLRKNKKLKKRLTKMRGGAAAAAAAGPYGPRYTAPIGDCFTSGDALLIPIGVPAKHYLSDAAYGTTLMYSDHAPIIYNLTNAPVQIKNDYMSIITWNVGSFGDFYNENTNTYNHKFNLQATEILPDYNTRLENLVNAMKDLLDNNNPKKGPNHPFLFCQELPFLIGGQKAAEAKASRTYFKTLLNDNGLELKCDISDRNEFGLIVKIGSNSQVFTVLNKEDYITNHYYNGKYIFPGAPGQSNPLPLGQVATKEWRRFEIYYYNFRDNTYYYVNIHAIYTEDPIEIVNFLNRIVDTIQMYHTSQQSQQSQQSQLPNINGVTIYLIGDYNFNIASPVINDLIASKYDSEPLNLFANPYLKPPRKISSMYKLTTRDAVGYSLIDNRGTRSPCNIDCILKLDLASG